MKSKLKIAAVALMLGSATVATAQTQTRAQTFADQFQQMQALASTSPYAFDAPPVFDTRSADPVGNASSAERFAEMQAESSNSSAFEPAPILAAQAADPASRESFAERFAEMQAESSNSGQFPTSGADAANSALAVAKPIGGTHVQASR
jgi:hypothetical protein